MGRDKRGEKNIEDRIGQEGTRADGRVKRKWVMGRSVE